MFTLPYEPLVVADTTNLDRDVWLDLRRTGIGGSDVSSILGVSPFGTARDTYYEKLKIPWAFEDDSNKYQKKIGHILEDVVAEMFSEVTGYPVFQIKKMYRSKEHPFMLADVDYFVALPDGTYAILECKTTSPDATDKWWKDGVPSIPLNYELQGRHYMSVMKINKVFFACLHGNSENYLIIRELDRDKMLEDEMIFTEEYFWNNHVLKEVPPPYTESGELIIKSTKRHFGYADPNANTVNLDINMSSIAQRILELTKQKDTLSKPLKVLDDEINRLKGLIIAEMGVSQVATFNLGDIPYNVTYNATKKEAITKENLKRLKNCYPDIYLQYVSISESRRFYLKKQKIEKNEAA